MKIKKYLYRLIGRRCPCESAPQPLNAGEIKHFQTLLKSPWPVIKNKKITKDFKFKDFNQAIDFTNQIAKIAEREQHHPNIEIQYNNVRVIFWTHDLNGLSESDFIMAAKIDDVYLSDKAD